MSVRTKSVYWSPDTSEVVERRYRSMLDAWPTEHAEHRIHTSQGETFAITAGRSDLPAVVLLPGSMASSAMWLETISALAGNFRVIAVDLIGDAGFSAPSRPWMRSDAYARWLDEVLGALKVSRAGFVGASLGGWIALDYAIRRTPRVHCLMLLAPAGIGRIRPGFMLRTAPLLYLGAWGHRKALGFDMGLSGRGATPEEGAFLDLFDAVRSGFRARMQPIPTFSSRDLRKLKMPVNVVLGGRDLVIDSQQAQRRVEANIGNGEVLMLPDAGHGLVNSTAMIREFLLRTGSGSA